MYSQVNEFQKAIELLEECKELDRLAWSNLAEISMHIESPNHHEAAAIFSEALEKSEGSNIYSIVSSNRDQFQSGGFSGVHMRYFTVSYSLEPLKYEGEVELPPYLFKPRLITLLSNFPVVEADTSPCDVDHGKKSKKELNAKKDSYPHAEPVLNSK